MNKLSLNFLKPNLTLLFVRSLAAVGKPGGGGGKPGGSLGGKVGGGSKFIKKIYSRMLHNC